MGYSDRPTRAVLTVALVLASVLGLASTAAAQRYQQTNLVSDTPGLADKTDPHLQNAWGVAFNPTAFVWVADNHKGVATLYDGAGNPQSLVVTILPASGQLTGSPTGIVFNGSSDFVVTEKGKSGASRFIFATEDGTIAGWSPDVVRDHAITAVPSKTGAVYKGLALASNGTDTFLYATDFHNARIDVFNKEFKPARLSGTFADPNLPAGYAPFGIQNLNGNLYVTYAKQDAARMDDVPGAGRGFVDVFDANGHLIRRVASRGWLNAPWGLAVAPADFGKFSNRLLVGNFGDGTINAYDVATGKFLGQFRGPDSKRLTIDGLWGISFGNGLLDQPTNVLFFAAGPNDENDGLYGKLEPASGKDDDHEGNEDDHEGKEDDHE